MGSRLVVSGVQLSMLAGMHTMRDKRELLKEIHTKQLLEDSENLLSEDIQKYRKKILGGRR